MNRSNMLPRSFAILRVNAYRGPQMQILRADRHRSHDYYIIENVEENISSSLRLHISNTHRLRLDDSIYTVRLRNPDTHSIIEVKYWYLPFVIQSLGVPFLEFQYRSWIPRIDHTLPLDTDIHINEVLRVIDRIQEQRLERIRTMEDRGIEDHYLPYGRHFDARGQDDYDDRLSLADDFVGVNRYRTRRPPTPPPQPEVRIVQVEVPVERIIVQTRNKPLPKSVGDILLANARGSSDTCPITALPFKDCSKLSITSCFHVFDLESLTRWQEDNTTCPVCRAKIENVVSE